MVPLGDVENQNSILLSVKHLPSLSPSLTVSLPFPPTISITYSPRDATALGTEQEL